MGFTAQDKAKTEEELKTAAQQAAAELDAQKAYYVKQLDVAKVQAQEGNTQAQAGSKTALEKAAKEGRAREAALAETVQVRGAPRTHTPFHSTAASWSSSNADTPAAGSASTRWWRGDYRAANGGGGLHVRAQGRHCSLDSEAGLYRSSRECELPT